MLQKLRDQCVCRPHVALKCNAPSARILEHPTGKRSDNERSRAWYPLEIVDCQAWQQRTSRIPQQTAPLASTRSFACQFVNSGSIDHQIQIRGGTDQAIDFHSHVSSSGQGTFDSKRTSAPARFANRIIGRFTHFSVTLAEVKDRRALRTPARGTTSISAPTHEPSGASPPPSH